MKRPWAKKPAFVFSPQERAMLRRRALRLMEHAFTAAIPYLIASDSWLIFKQANEFSYWKMFIFIVKDWWMWHMHGERMMRWRERFFHWRTGRDGSELWDKKLGEPTGTAQIQREELKAMREGREPSGRIQ